MRGNMTTACENGNALSDTLVLKERKGEGDNLQVTGVNEKSKMYNNLLQFVF